MKLSELPIKEICLENMPFYFRRPNTGNTHIICGPVKRGGNEPYCYAQEKQCADHVCRVLCPDKTFDKALVIRDDGTVWSIWLSNFEEVHLLKIADDTFQPKIFKEVMV